MQRRHLVRATAATAATAAVLSLIAGAQSVRAGGPTVDMSLTKVHNTSPFVRGAQESYSITVHNGGPGNLAAGTSDGVQVTDTLPADLTFVSGTGTGWACVAAAQLVQCSVTASSPAVNSGSDYPVITLTVDVSATAGSTITNTATVSVGGTAFAFDNNNLNNSSTDVVDVSGATPAATPTATAAPATATPTSIVAPATGSATGSGSSGGWTPIIVLGGVLLIVTALAWRRRPT
jgi:uncharacterized repeat protein (TIGR01451 family)